MTPSRRTVLRKARAKAAGPALGTLRGGGGGVRCSTMQQPAAG
ncbi:hypothetical protein [Streptomyces sp. ISL-94]|nr:hypothetical protein [Streptomyces sp. ISL-94]